MHQQERISLRIQRRRFQEIKDFELGRLPARAITLQKVGVLPTLDYFHFKGYLALVSALRGCILASLKGCLACFVACVKVRSWLTLCASRDSSYLVYFQP